MLHHRWLIGSALLIGGVALTLGLAGCGGGPATTPVVAAAKPPNVSLLEPLLLAGKPAQARAIADVRDFAKDGEEVVVQGIIPPGGVKAFLNDRAGFVIMAKEDIDKNREELDCAEPG